MIDPSGAIAMAMFLMFIIIVVIVGAVMVWQVPGLPTIAKVILFIILMASVIMLLTLPWTSGMVEQLRTQGVFQ